MNTPRFAGIDYLRGFAILSVVIFHYKYFPYGYLGVDLFFVISGFLVGGQLYDFLVGYAPLKMRYFFIRRFTKIFPSYFFYLLAAGLFSHWLYKDSHPEIVFLWADWKSYFLFFSNYRPQGSYIFAHVWSLCVEEHFYILAPVMVLALYTAGLRSKHMTVLALGGLIVAINILRWWLATTGHETLVTSHARIDSMLWGILAYAIVREEICPPWVCQWVGIFGVAFLLLLVGIDYGLDSSLYRNAYFHGLTPIAFFMLIVALARVSVPFLGGIHWVAKYSYNYYLWHMLLYYLVHDYFGQSILGLAVFAVVGLVLAVATTKLIEKPGLRLRKVLPGR